MERRTRSLRQSNDESNMLCSRSFEQYFELLLRRIPAEKKEKFVFLDSLWFHIYTGGDKKNDVIGWIRKKKLILKKQYLVVPIVIWSHWRLLIISGLGKNTGNNSRCMVLLDSLQSAEQGIEPNIRMFVLDILTAFGRAETKQTVNTIPILKPKVPQQVGGEECGWYVLMYTKLFIENICDNFSISKGFSYFMTANWFTVEDFKEFEVYVRGLKEIGEDGVDKKDEFEAANHIEEVEQSQEDGNIIIESEIAMREEKEAELIGEEKLINVNINEGEDYEDDGDNGEYGDERFSDSDYELSHELEDDIHEQFVDEGMQDFDENVKMEVKRQEEHDNSVKMQEDGKNTDLKCKGKKKMEVERRGKGREQCGSYLRIEERSKEEKNDISHKVDVQSVSEDSEHAFYDSHSSSDEGGEKKDKAKWKKFDSQRAK